MAKNKNRDRAKQQGSAAERSQEHARDSSMEAHSQSQTQAQGSPANVARKQQKRFGHN